MSAIMEFRNVSFSHGERTIFNNLNFSVQQGEMFALMGANGVGKTTLLRLASSLLRPSMGEIFVRDRELSQWSRRQLSCCVALVPQHLEIPFAYRVEEIVAQGRVPHLRLFGGLSTDDREAVESAMEAVDILKMRDRLFTGLSGGERQRVKIAIGLAQEPTLMLLDEPTQHLDLGRQIELMGLLKRLVERGITVVAAMHDLALVREHCSAGILLTPDAAAIVGRVADLLQPERLEKAFSVERAGLKRYLATQTPAELSEALKTSPSLESIMNSRRKFDWQHRMDGARRKDEEISAKRCRHYPHHSHGARNWDTD